MNDPDPDESLNETLDYEITGQYASKILKSHKLQSDDISRAVQIYYEAQGLRMAYSNKSRTKSNELTEWFDGWLGTGEHTIQPMLTRWVKSDDAPAEAQWAYLQMGIGPVIAAALSAHIDVTPADSASAVWKLAASPLGKPPASTRRRARRSPYNAQLKVLCWKIGESFVKVKGKLNAFYGRSFVNFKQQEEQRNDSGHYAEAAARELETKKIAEKETKVTLQSGKLTQGHLHARAKSRTVKILLVHYWQIGRKSRGLDARPTYTETIQGA
jgi:hypothetical protein